MRNSRPLIQLSIVIGASVALLVCCIGVTLVISPVASTRTEELFRPRVRQTFTTEAWKIATPGDGKRYKMANDLVRTGRLKKLDYDSVIKLLGEPGIRETNGEVIFLSFGLARQHLYPSRGFFLPRSYFLNVDSWVLEIELRRDKVVSTSIRCS
jgi:hypothetical protein